MTLIEKARHRRAAALRVTQGLRANVFFDPEGDAQPSARGSVLEMLANLPSQSGARGRAIVRRAA
ncbi:hypothetical protein ILP92_11010 [Maribius pontilimi]|uniref:Uncharacterized protein n=1 Tax=Palleronia pontilimi TaxID=1964209 RepID=A0A934MEB3_9RHOB|nr:hypothetical protein [Palleronia pontilimi]MBJ3763276.1 hypothetical protein [Palleronia pontilimi]